MNHCHTVNLTPIYNLSTKPMLSLYIHIPFCYHKCAYCSFFVLPEEDIIGQEWENKPDKLQNLKQNYLEALLDENKQSAKTFSGQQIRTIYIGGWTPFQLGEKRLFELIDNVLASWDCEFLEELSIELNPDPFDDVLDFVRKAQKKYKNIFRLRFSFGIQTFDDKILASSKRNYVFNNLINWFREMIEIKEHTTCYNLDFIAFGDTLGWPHPNPLQKGEGAIVEENRLPRDKRKREFFKTLADSQAFDWFSVYTLELFPGAERYYDKRKLEVKSWASKTETEGAIFSDEDETIWQEFQWIKKTIMDAWYKRYEISNFALSGKRSLHNMVYWRMENYVWLGINASSCLVADAVQTIDPILLDTALRFKNTTKWKQYLDGSFLDKDSYIWLTEDERLSEEVMLLLRTDQWISLEKYRWVLVKDIDKVLLWLIESKHIKLKPDTDSYRLTSKWMDVYNAVLMEVLEKI